MWTGNFQKGAGEEGLAMLNRYLNDTKLGFSKYYSYY